MVDSTFVEAGGRCRRRRWDHAKDEGTVGHGVVRRGRGGDRRARGGRRSAEWIGAAYGLQPLDDDLALLLRHRAVLFGVLGAGLMVAAVRPRWRPAAVPACAVALLSFPLLAVAGGPVNAELTRVAALDVAAVLALGAGVALAPRTCPIGSSAS
ncbi:hypothetical protein [Nocardia sp. NPDC057227]|uniref:hypothetical protein n=1 Tax=Nocardia sp. NPDC057227 TaxID=3346056 RepID=UPI003641BA6D